MDAAGLREKYGRLGEGLHRWRGEGARLLRLVMSLRVDPNEPTVPDWESADTSLGDAPVGAHEWQAWLLVCPPRVAWLAQLTRLEGPNVGVPSRADVFDFCLERLPEVAHLVLHAGTTNGAAAALLEARAVAAGQAFGRHVGWGSVAFERRSAEHLAAWLSARAGLEEKVDGFAQRALRVLAHRFADLELGAGAYASALGKVLKSLRASEGEQVRVRADWLSEAELCALLSIVTRKEPLLHAVLAQVSEQAQPHGLRAIASLLGDKKVGDVALFWLACQGDLGAVAARECWSAGGKGAKAKLAAERIARFASLPRPQPVGVESGVHLSERPVQHPRRKSRLPTGHREPVLSPERLMAAYAAPLKPGLLNAEEWADYLQVASLDEALDSPEDAWGVANALNLLGHGASGALFDLAAHRLDPSPPGYAYSNLHGVGWGALFLWAGAGLEAYVNAASAALANAAHAGQVLSWMEALSAWPPAWADEAREKLSISMARSALPRGRSGLWAEVASALSGDPSAYPRLVALGDAAAHPLTLMSQLLPTSDCEEQRASFALLGLSSVGDGQALAPTNTTYAAVLLDLASFGRGKVQRVKEHEWRWPGRRGLVEGVLWGPAVTLLDGMTELPSAEELLDLCTECPLYDRRGGEQLGRVSSGSGVRRISWRECGSGSALFVSYEACAWSVKDGVVVALWNSDEVDGVERLVGLPFLPD